MTLWLVVKKESLLDGTNYDFWRIRMQTYLISLGYDIWESITNIYIAPSTPSVDVVAKKLFENDSKSKNAIMCGLVDIKLVKVMGCKSAKEIWEKLKSIHEEDDKIKKAKLQMHQF